MTVRGLLRPHRPADTSADPAGTKTVGIKLKLTVEDDRRMVGAGKHSPGSPEPNGFEEESMKRAISWLALILAFGASTAAQAQTRITVLVPEPLKKQMEQLTSQFNAKTGNRVQMAFGTGVSTRQSAGWGGALDVTILFSPYDAALKTANVDKSTQTSIGQLRLAVAVKKGAPKPDISTLAATKQTLLNAKSIASVDPPQGSVGGAALLALDKMGITDQVKPKIKWLAGGGDVEESVAKGETEMTLGPYLSDMGNPGG